MEFDTCPINRCSKTNANIYQECFCSADSDGDGRLIGKDATSFLAMSNLPREDLKQVWAIADSKRQGYLGFKEFITAMQLVSLAQAGHAVTSDFSNAEVDFENLQLQTMEGMDGLLAKKKRVAKRLPDSNGSLILSPRANWFSSSKSSKKLSPIDYVTSITDGLKKLYAKKLKPLEVTYHFSDFVSRLLTNSDFDAKPMVMLLGQYSTGKTTFIKHLLRTSYPGAHIGPEPTTDRFVVVMNGPDERSIPGNTIAVQADMPFSGLTTFGTSFLSKFECSQLTHPLLESITLVDTPGVLSGKSNERRGLMRVYGALMWSLGKVQNTPEVSRVYIGSFSDRPINEDLTGPLGKELFEKEQNDLLTDLKNIPKKACDRRINEFVKRARAAKIHAYIISHLKKEMPAMMGKIHHLPAGDFPNVEHFREVLSGYNIDIPQI
ncbi:unnamed protein product [Withania somnifera]